MRYYVCDIFSLSYHSLVILYLRMCSGICKRFFYLQDIRIFSSITLLSSVLVFSSFLFPLCVIYIRHRSVLEQCVLKYGIVSLTSCIPRIAVALFLQFVFVITNNNRIKCCSRNESFYPILYHHHLKFVTEILKFCIVVIFLAYPVV